MGRDLPEVLSASLEKYWKATGAYDSCGILEAYITSHLNNSQKHGIQVTLDCI